MSDIKKAIKNYINNVIPYNNYKNDTYGLPRRGSDYFLDKDEKDLVNISLNQGKMLVYPVHVHEMNIKSGSNKRYNLILHCVTYDGQKCAVIVKGIRPHVLVRVPDGEDANKFQMKIKDKILEKLSQIDINGINIESLDEINIISGKPFEEYVHNEVNYLDIKFLSNKERIEVINMLLLDGYETACNDTSGTFYHRSYFAENSVQIHNWYMLDGVTKICNNYGSKCPIQFEVNIQFFQKVDIEKYNPESNLYVKPKKGYPTYDYDKLFKKQKIRVLAWDIETANIKFGNVPQPEEKDSRIFNIGMGYYDYYSYDPILKIGLITKPCSGAGKLYDKLGLEREQNIMDVYCESESELIKAFILTIQRLQPDYIIGFNDWEYDWPWILQRGNKYDLLGDLYKAMNMFYFGQEESSLPQLYKSYYREQNIKISAELTIGQRFLTFKGTACLDIRTLLRRQEKMERTGLKDFLQRFKLVCKDDMPYDELHRRSVEGTKLEIAEVNKYCREDADRCQQLMLKNDLIRGASDKANVTYTTMHDSFIYADGVRVGNTTYNYAYASKFFRNSKRYCSDSGKFVGAFVVPPKKGILRPKPTFMEIFNCELNDYTRSKHDKIRICDMKDANDFAVIVNNASKDWRLILTKYVKRYLKVVYKYISQFENTSIDIVRLKIKDYFKEEYLQDMKLEMELIPQSVNYSIDLAKLIAIQYATTLTDHPATALDFASLYPSIICDKNISPETSITDREVAERLIEEGVKFNYTEVPMKSGEIKEVWTVDHENDVSKYGIYIRILIDLKENRAEIKNNMKPWGKLKEEKLQLWTLEERSPGGKYYDDWSNIEFWYQFYDTKQKTVKVLMNTFYGIIGAPSNCSYKVELAGGVTTYGRDNLKAVYKFLTEEYGCNIYYGDSVVGTTALLCRYTINGEYIHKYILIEDLCDELSWYELASSEILAGGGIEPKQYNLPKYGDVEVWSDGGFTRIKSVMRHKTTKDIYSVVTNKGAVKVTADHSLLDNIGNEVSPRNISIGDTLLSHTPPEGLFSREDMLACKDPDLKNALIYYTYYNGHMKDNPCSVVDIINLGNCSNDISRGGYVYDLETENHHYGAGIGELIVHNTDSLYFSVNYKHFLEYDIDYYIRGCNEDVDKMEYCSNLVNRTFEIIPKLNSVVNTFLFKKNGTEFLKMAYEEILYFAIWLGKKKYLGIQHISGVNFKADTLKEVFVRGLDIIKKGCSPFAVKVVTKLVLGLLKLDNLYSVYDNVIMALKGIKETEWDYEDFVKTGTYKKSPAILLFVKRMAEERGIKYNIGERLEFVICKKPLQYDPVTHAKIALTTGDRYEPLDCVKEEKLEVDIDYYIYHEVIGQLGRFIAYMDEFYEGVDMSEDRSDRDIDADVVSNSKKYLEQLYSSWNGGDVEINQSKARKALKKFVSGVASKKTLNLTQGLVVNKYKNKDDLVDKLITGADEEAQKVSHGIAVDTYNRLRTHLKDKCGIPEREINGNVNTLLYGKRAQAYNLYKTECVEEINDAVAVMYKLVFDLFTSSGDGVVDKCVSQLLENNFLEKTKIQLADKKESEIKAELISYATMEGVGIVGDIEKSVDEESSKMKLMVDKINMEYMIIHKAKCRLLVLDYISNMVSQDISKEPSKDTVEFVFGIKDDNIDKYLSDIMSSMRIDSN